MLNQINHSISKSEEAYKTLQNTTKDQRALALATVGVAVEEDELIRKASEQLSRDESSLKNELSNLLAKKELGEPVSRRDLLNIAALSEENYQKATLKKQESWEGANSSFLEVIESYRENTRALFYMQVLSLFSLVAIVLFMLGRDNIKKEMKEKDKLHSHLFSSLLEGVFLCNKDGRVIACNSSGALISGREPKSLMKKNIGALFSGMNLCTENQETINSQRFFNSLIEEGSIVFGKTIAVTGKNGFTNWFNLNAQPFSPFTEGGSSTMLFSFSNITEKVHAQNTIKQQQIELMEGSKLRTIGEMAGGIAHEIDNPLATIYAATERLSRKAGKNDVVESEVVIKASEKILKTVKRISAVVKSLLSLSREADVDVQFVQLREVIDLAMDLAQIELIRTRVEFTLESEDLDSVIQCYPTQVAQVLLNLTKNAIDAIEESQEKWLKLDVTNKGEFIRFKLTDSGKGIPKSVVDKILLPFFTTKEEGKGTGLGLSISRSIVAAHGGKIYVDMDSPNTCFVVELPIKYSEPELLDDPFKEVA